MNEDIKYHLAVMAGRFNDALDRLHDELLAKLRSMAKSVGQRTRVDRIRKSTGIGY